MAQGPLRKTKTTASSSKRPSILAPKKGARAIAPKKKTLRDARKVTKKYTSGMTAKTEQTLAERAGHLEMLGGGKKDRGKGGAGGAKAGGAKTERRRGAGAGGGGKG